MTIHFSQNYLRTIHLQMSDVVSRVKLPLRHNWRGQFGGLLGPGVGSSVDFRDHRPYTPGDDPRYINWQAYARSEQYSMKLFQDEITPRIDLVLDASPSMFYDEKKQTRTLELLYFCVESSLGTGTNLRIFLVSGNSLHEISQEAILEYRLSLPEESVSEPMPPNLNILVWRQGSLRIFISDLLYPGSPDSILAALNQGKGHGIIFAPYCLAEGEPKWFGNVLLIDCETKQSRKQQFNAELLTGYQNIYRRHFELWYEHCRKRGVACSRVPSEGNFLGAIEKEALPKGIVTVQ